MRAFWRGNGTNVVRIFPYSAVQFSTNDACKRLLASPVGVLPSSLIGMAPSHMSGSSRERKLAAGYQGWWAHSWETEAPQQVEGWLGTVATSASPATGCCVLGPVESAFVSLYEAYSCLQSFNLLGSLWYLGLPAPCAFS